MARAAGAGDGQLENAEAIDDALELFRAGGGRVTTARRLILRCLLSAEHHGTAEELAAEVRRRAPDINISTIYRNLDELERLGVVVHAHLGHGPATYYLASHAHGHLVCKSCGAVVEVPEQLFTSLAEAAQLLYDFAIEPGHFAVLGRCSSCATSDRTEAAVPRR